MCVQVCQQLRSSPARTCGAKIYWFADPALGSQQLNLSLRALEKLRNLFFRHQFGRGLFRVSPVMSIRFVLCGGFQCRICHRVRPFVSVWNQSKPLRVYSIFNTKKRPVEIDSQQGVAIVPLEHQGCSRCYPMYCRFHRLNDVRSESALQPRFSAMDRQILDTFAVPTSTA